MSNCGLSKSYTGTLHFLTLHGCSSTMKIGGTGKEEEKGPKGRNKLLLNFDTLGKNVKKKLRLSIVNFSTLAICNAKKLANFYQRAFWLYLPWEFRSRLFLWVQDFGGSFQVWIHVCIHQSLTWHFTLNGFTTKKSTVRLDMSRAFSTSNLMEKVDDSSLFRDFCGGDHW